MSNPKSLFDRLNRAPAQDAAALMSTSLSLWAPDPASPQEVTGTDSISTHRKGKRRATTPDEDPDPSDFDPGDPDPDPPSGGGEAPSGAAPNPLPRAGGGGGSSGGDDPSGGGGGGGGPPSGPAPSPAPLGPG